MQDAAASVLTDQFAEVLERLPAGLDRLALETKAIQRKRELVDGAALLRIALARGPGGLSLPQTAAWASMLGIADLSNPGVKYRPGSGDGLSRGAGGTTACGESTRRRVALARPQLAASPTAPASASAPAILAAYRLRWQIERAFKRLKSLLHIDRLPTHTERGSRSWLYAPLILALLCDDLSQDFLESSP
jgi:hypothetical protein